MIPKNIREQISNLIVRTGSKRDLVELLKRYPAIYRMLRSILGTVLGEIPISREIISGPLKGYKMVLGPHDRNLYLVDKYEKAIADLFRESCCPGMHVLDVGANVGYFSLLFSVLVGPKGYVYAIEPFPQNADKIREMVRVNKLMNVSLFPVAAANRSGTVSFQTDLSGAMGHIVKGPKWESAQIIQVETVRIDDLVRENGINRIDLVKIDVEGSEHEVLFGMQNVISRFKPLIICEWHPDKAGPDYEPIWEGFGYRSFPMKSVSATEPFHVIAKPI
jgi:FkbM family methyltransferase